MIYNNMVFWISLVFICVGATTFSFTEDCDEKTPRHHLQIEGEKIAKKYDFKLIGNGHSEFLAGSKNGRWGLSFTSDQKMTLEEIKPIIADMSYTLLYMLYQEPSFLEFQECLDHYYPKWKLLPLSVNELGFRLAFWDKDVNRPLYPYLAQVRLADGKIYYHYANPETQALEAPIVESLESLNLPKYK